MYTLFVYFLSSNRAAKGDRKLSSRHLSRTGARFDVAPVCNLGATKLAPVFLLPVVQGSVSKKGEHPLCGHALLIASLKLC